MLNILDIAPSLSCNMKCLGCVAHANPIVWEGYEGMGPKDIRTGHAIKTGHYMNPSALEKFVKAYFKPTDTVLQFSGGEPLLWDPLPYLMLELQGYRKVIVSNGYCVKGFIDSLNGNENFLNIRWKISYHPDMRPMHTLISDIECLPRENVLLNYYCHPKWITTGEINQHIDAMSKSGYRFHVNPFKGTYDGKEYTKDDPVFDPYVKYDQPWRTFALWFLNANGKVQQCYKHLCGHLGACTIETLSPALPKCIDKKKMSMCDCANAIYALWPEAQNA